MYTIDKTDYGYAMRFYGPIGEEEMRMWRDEAGRRIADACRPFFFWIDGRELSTLSPQALEEWNQSQNFFRSQGLERSVILLNDPSKARQFSNIAEKAGRGDWERCIDASSTSNWVQRGLDWIFKAIDYQSYPKSS